MSLVLVWIWFWFGKSLVKFSKILVQLTLCGPQCCRKHPWPSSLIWGIGGHWRFLTGVLHVDLDFDMVNGIWYTPYPKFWLSILTLKVQRTSMSFKSSFGALEDAGGSWLGFGILILIWIWSLVFDTPLIQNLALYLDFEGAKNIHVL